MAFLRNCLVCDKTTLHSSRGECLQCKERQEKEIQENWLKMSDTEKISDLFFRVRRLEKIINMSEFSGKF